jgi:hypothetical protein
MKYISLLLFIFSFHSICQSQNMKTFVSVNPNWDISVSSVNKSSFINIDSVYLFNKKQNNRDSTLVMIQYFDSAAQIIERDEFRADRSVWRITNFNYQNNLLLTKEIMSADMFVINNSNITKHVYNNMYDINGNIISVVDSSYFGDSLKSVSVTVWDREYDSAGHLIKEFETLPKQKAFLHYTYLYTDGNLTEIKSYDFKKNWIYSHVYEYDTQSNTKSIFLVNNSKVLTSTSFYDNKKRLIKEVYNNEGLSNWYPITNIYSYNVDGVLESQIFQDLKGRKYYYKHYYEKR